MHRDGPLVTATITLNPRDEYDGGGTLIEALEDYETQGIMDERDATEGSEIGRAHV